MLNPSFMPPVIPPEPPLVASASQPEPGANLLKLSDEQKKKIAERCIEEIDASNTAKGTLPDRWAKNEQIYHVDRGAATMKIAEGIEPYALPYYRQKADEVIGSIYSSITSVYPPVQVIDEGDGANQETIERVLDAMAQAGDFNRQFKAVLLPVMNTNIGVMRVRPLQKGKPVGIEWIHPKNVMCYPSEETSFRDAKTVGHRFSEMAYRIKNQQAAGKYYPGEIFAVDDVNDEQPQGQRHLTTPTTPVTTDDSQVELWEVVTEIDLGEGYRKYICCIAKNQGKLLSCEEYPYDVPWYFDMRLSDPEGSVWPQGSFGQIMQTLQGPFNDGMTLLLQGGLMSAFPFVVISGGSLPTKTRKYGPSTLYETNTDVKVQVVQNGFNPSTIPGALQEIQSLGDGVSRISRLGTSQDLPASTSATAAAGMLQAQDEGKDQYTESISPSIQAIWEFLYELLGKHFEEIKAALGSRFPPDLDYETVATRTFEFKVTGQGGNSSPQTVLNKLVQLMGMAQNPDSNLDYRKCEQKAVDALDLPFSSRGLMKDPVAIDPNHVTQLFQAVASGQLPPDQASAAMLQDIRNAQTQSPGNPAPVPEPSMDGSGPAMPLGNPSAVGESPLFPPAGP